LDLLQSDLPDRLPLVVMMEKRELNGNPWVDHQWKAVGVAVDSQRAIPHASGGRVHESDGIIQELYTGFVMELQIDECESYYHNLLSPQPRCYVVATIDDEQVPVPRLVSLSFDEAHAYMEGEEELFTVDVPAELYRWSEAFVLQHYVPEKRHKRKRRDWNRDQNSA